MIGLVKHTIIITRNGSVGDIDNHIGTFFVMLYVFK